MPATNYSGKPFYRHYSPTSPRILPNGTQSISAYTAPLAFYDPAEAAYSVKIGNRSMGDSIYQVLLFGSDYPAVVSGHVEYRDCLNAEKNPIIPSVVTQTFSLNSVDGFNKSFFNGFQSFGTTDFKYQQVITGRTITNDVEIGGFANEVTIPFNGVYADNDGDFGVCPQFVTFNAIMNDGSASASSMFAKLNFNDFTISFRIPIILWEPDFTQQIKDNKLTISAPFKTPFNNQIPAIFDVVGIWYSGTPPLA